MSHVFKKFGNFISKIIFGRVTEIFLSVDNEFLLNKQISIVFFKIQNVKKILSFFYHIYTKSIFASVAILKHCNERLRQIQTDFCIERISKYFNNFTIYSLIWLRNICKMTILAKNKVRLVTFLTEVDFSVWHFKNRTFVE